jgi:hypothetical protein
MRGLRVVNSIEFGPSPAIPYKMTELTTRHVVAAGDLLPRNQTAVRPEHSRLTFSVSPAGVAVQRSK